MREIRKEAIVLNGGVQEEVFGSWIMIKAVCAFMSHAFSQLSNLFMMPIEIQYIIGDLSIIEVLMQDVRSACRRFGQWRASLR